MTDDLASSGPPVSQNPLGTVESRGKCDGRGSFDHFCPSLRRLQQEQRTTVQDKAQSYPIYLHHLLNEVPRTTCSSSKTNSITTTATITPGTSTSSTTCTSSGRRSLSLKRRIGGSDSVTDSVLKKFSYRERQVRFWAVKWRTGTGCFKKERFKRRFKYKWVVPNGSPWPLSKYRRAHYAASFRRTKKALGRRWRGRVWACFDLSRTVFRRSSSAVGRRVRAMRRANEAPLRQDRSV